jgi:hypothetical protein
MKDKALILDPVITIIDLTYKIEKKEKFAFVNISRSAINSLLPESEKKPPKYFIKAVTFVEDFILTMMHILWTEIFQQFSLNVFCFLN